MPAEVASLVFTFHGTGGDEHQFAGLIQQILSEAGIISPRGDVSECSAARFFRRTGEGVYDMDDLAVRTEKVVGFIQAHRKTNPNAPVYRLGYSNGANIVASLIIGARNCSTVWC
jgi:phospholipase/carboxylesterase